jgi:G6PDH family F420-dependent oxidoreductase
MISDHFHPWTTSQGNAPFVRGVLGAIARATERLEVGTGVTAPIRRIHPAIVAHAAATAATLMPGRFFLGVGTGENLNEHIVGRGWPPYKQRAAMLEEAVAIIRALWKGDDVDHRGDHFTVENARLYTLPEEPPPIVVAASGPRSAALAGRIGVGLINFVADAKVVERFDSDGPLGRPHYLQVNVCWNEQEAEARRIAYNICPTVALQGELGNQLPTPSHYQQTVKMLDEDAVAKVIVCGPDPQRHIEKIQAGIDAGYDRIHVYQVGPDQEGFFRFYQREILPVFR